MRSYLYVEELVMVDNSVQIYSMGGKNPDFIRAIRNHLRESQSSAKVFFINLNHWLNNDKYLYPIFLANTMNMFL